MAALAVEMHMLVIIVLMAVVTVTQLVAHPVAAILYDMHQMVIAK